MLKTKWIEHGKLAANVQCEECKVIHSMIHQNFDQIREELQYTGWLSWKDCMVWKHQCPNCHDQATGEHKVNFNEMLEKRKVQKELFKQYHQ